MTVEQLHSIRDYVDENGDVHHMSDLTAEQAEVIVPFTVSSRGLRKVSKSKNRRNRLVHVPAVDMGLAIDNALYKAREEYGRPLTEEEQIKIASDTEQKMLRGEL